MKTLKLDDASPAWKALHPALFTPEMVERRAGLVTYLGTERFGEIIIEKEEK